MSTGPPACSNTGDIIAAIQPFTSIDETGLSSQIISPASAVGLPVLGKLNWCNWKLWCPGITDAFWAKVLVIVWVLAEEEANKLLVLQNSSK